MHELEPHKVRALVGLLTPEEVAGAFGITVETLAKWRTNGTGPASTKPGKQVFYREQDVVDWLTKCASNNDKSQGDRT